MSLLVVGGMTIDDVVLADGDVHRRVAGGNALYSALGARLWGVRSELVSFVGADYPVDLLDHLDSTGIATRHVARLDQSSIRLWILYEEDGRRQIHLQHDSPALTPIAHLATSTLDELLGHPGSPELAHVAALPVSVQRAVARALSSRGVPFTLDSLEAKGSVGGDLSDYLMGPDLSPRVFLPSQDEFSLLFGDLGSTAFAAWSHATTTETLVVKDGARGSHVYSPPTASGQWIPAFSSTVVDPTGAGDAYCGGFAAGLLLGRPPLECAVMGTVSASIVVEGIGTDALLAATHDDALSRRDLLVRTATPAGGF